ncbi:MAG: Rid family hydrolase, partial [Bryobacteraceae bacterium]
VVADTARLAFQVSPLTAKGLLSQQTREALKALMRQHRRASIVKLRAFVAGAGDMRRVAMIVSETFADKKQPIPALSVIQAGALPREGAQVVLESTAVEKKPVNPNGVAFLSGLAAPSVQQSVRRLETALAAASLQPADMLRVTCFVGMLDDSRAGFAAAQSTFPQAALDLVQMQREPALPPAECEGVARLRAPQSEPVRFLSPTAASDSPDASQTVLVAAPKLVISGTQLAFHDQASDVRLAFERLGKALDPLGAKLSGVVMTHLYSLSRSTAERVQAVRLEFYDKAHPPATTMLLFEGLPSLDASFAVDVIAVPKK